MRIDCPSCAASYEVPDSRLAGRKAVRCARCGEQWVPVPDDAVPPAGFPEPVQPVPAGIEPMAPRLAPSQRSLGLRLAWAASVLVVVAGLGAAVAWQDRIVQAWPPSLRVYAALGLAHKPH